MSTRVTIPTPTEQYIHSGDMSDVILPGQGSDEQRMEDDMDYLRSENRSHFYKEAKTIAAYAHLIGAESTAVEGGHAFDLQPGLLDVGGGYRLYEANAAVLNVDDTETTGMNQRTDNVSYRLATFDGSRCSFLHGYSTLVSPDFKSGQVTTGYSSTFGCVDVEGKETIKTDEEAAQMHDQILTSMRLALDTDIKRQVSVFAGYARSQRDDSNSKGQINACPQREPKAGGQYTDCYDFSSSPLQSGLWALRSVDFSSKEGSNEGTNTAYYLYTDLERNLLCSLMMDQSDQNINMAQVCEDNLDGSKDTSVDQAGWAVVRGWVELAGAKTEATKYNVE